MELPSPEYIFSIALLFSSERNTSRSSLQPPTSSADHFSAALFGSQPYGSLSPAAMLNFGGPNGMAPPPFAYPGSTAMTPPTHSGFPFGASDLMPPFSHGSPSAQSKYFSQTGLTVYLILVLSN